MQGRTKAGGQSQQRFARRRDNQARQAYEAAADHAARILDGLTGPLVTGGDHAAIGEVLADPRLGRLTVLEPWLPVPDPKRAVLEKAVLEACAVRVEVSNADRAADSGAARRLLLQRTVPLRRDGATHRPGHGVRHQRDGPGDQAQQQLGAGVRGGPSCTSTARIPPMVRTVRNGEEPHAHHELLLRAYASCSTNWESAISR